MALYFPFITLIRDATDTSSVVTIRRAWLRIASTSFLFNKSCDDTDGRISLEKERLSLKDYRQFQATMLALEWSALSIMMSLCLYLYSRNRVPRAAFSYRYISSYLKYWLFLSIIYLRWMPLLMPPPLQCFGKSNYAIWYTARLRFRLISFD